MWRRSLISSLAIILILESCEEPESLKPPSGVEGEITYVGSWPDSIKAAALIVLEGLDPENLADYLVTFSIPDTPSTEKSEYFFQLEPGPYFIAGVGLTIDPILFLANFDSILAAENLPLVLLDKNPPLIQLMKVNSNEVQIINHEINFKP